MEILAHRGVWKTHGDGNTLPALESALKQGFGIETDIRSYHDRIHIAHDPVHCSDGLLTFDTFLELARSFPSQPIFLNVKEDGLLKMLFPYRKTLEELYVVFFDMSVPQLIQYAKHFPSRMLCTRISDYEPYPSAIELCDWIWVDGFTRTLEESEIRGIARKYAKNFAFVSPEIHQRDPAPLWRILGKTEWLPKELVICTDLATTLSKESQA